MNHIINTFNRLKSKHPDYILFFRMGDFYETYGQDAIAASQILGITLIRRANGNNASIEYAYFPHYALDTYLPKLIHAGKRVAIYDQQEDLKSKELVTPNN